MADAAEEVAVMGPGNLTHMLETAHDNARVYPNFSRKIEDGTPRKIGACSTSETF
jgi:hypothetical protein